MPGKQASARFDLMRMVHIQVFIDSPELIYELPATEREILEARMDEALSVL